MSLAAQTTSQTSAEGCCAHCGLPALAASHQGPVFCCAGCETVYHLLNTEDLSGYYRVRESLGSEGRPAVVTSKSYAEFDDPAFTAAYVEARGADLLQAELYSEGMSCAACVWLIEKVLQRLPGVREVTVHLGRSVVRVAWDPRETKLSELARCLDSFGYPPHAAPKAGALGARSKEERNLLLRIGVAGAAAGNAMLMAFALYSGAHESLDAEIWKLFRWGSLVVTTPAVLWAASIFYKRAWAALRARTPHMDVPISLGITVGFIFGAWNTYRGVGEIYFDSLATLIFLLLVGRWIQTKSQRKALDTAELMFSLAPRTARLVSASGVREVPAETVPVGEMVEVRSGEVIPVDGIVVEGSSAVDSSLLTGEPLPQDVAVGVAVYAGTVNLSAALKITASASGQASRVGALLKSVQEASERRPPIVLLADRISAYFVGAVIVLAGVTLWLGWQVSPEVAIQNTVALLIVSCPCALGMATPLSVSAALGQAARRGILVKGGAAVEKLAQANAVVFDKTGTLTQGRMQLVHFCGDEQVAPLVRALEAQSAHPIAKALHEGLTKLTHEPPVDLDVSEVRVELGSGIAGLVQGRQLRVGTQRFAVETGARIPGFAQSFAESQAQAARTPIWITVDGEVRAVAALADPLRPDAGPACDRLRSLGLGLSVLSGDHPQVVAQVGRELGLTEARGAASPEDKRVHIENLRGQRSVVMVGDGVNDAAALAAASVGVAVHGGAEASLNVADVFLTRQGLLPVVELIEGARRTLAVIRRGVVFSLLYNLVAVALAMTGTITPLIAAILMPLSSLTVIVNAYRSRTFDAPHKSWWHRTTVSQPPTVSHTFPRIGPMEPRDALSPVISGTAKPAQVTS